MSLTGAEGNRGHRAAAGLCELSPGPELSSVLAAAVGTTKADWQADLEVIQGQMGSRY